MSKYTAKIYTGNYYDRQLSANRDQCVCYAEQHFNSASSEFANYSLAVVSNNASITSRKWGELYAKMVKDSFIEVPKSGGTNGILVGGYNGRGDSNIKRTNMPAILCEPLFLTNAQHQRIIKSSEGQTKLAVILIDSIKQMFPQGGLIGLSIGHVGKESNPTDKGAYVPTIGYEGEFAREVILKAAQIINKEMPCM